jgi:hypothetical protein
VTNDIVCSNAAKQRARIGTAMLAFLESLSKILGAVALPVVLAVLGYWFNDSLKSQELNVKYVEIAVNVLSRPPSEETKPLRAWAIEVINAHASVKIDADLKDILIESEPLPANLLTNPTNGFRESQGEREINRIILSDTQNTNVESELKVLNALKVSYHYMISADGKILTLVDEKNIAYHTAKFNSNSIGIGIAHVSGTPYTDAQIQALRTLLPDIAKRRDISASNIVGKSELDARKQSDFSKIKLDVLSTLAQ